MFITHLKTILILSKFRPLNIVQVLKNFDLISYKYNVTIDGSVKHGLVTRFQCNHCKKLVSILSKCIEEYNGEIFINCDCNRGCSCNSYSCVLCDPLGCRAFNLNISPKSHGDNVVLQCENNHYVDFVIQKVSMNFISTEELINFRTNLDLIIINLSLNK